MGSHIDRRGEKGAHGTHVDRVAPKTTHELILTKSCDRSYKILLENLDKIFEKIEFFQTIKNQALNLKKALY